MFGWCWNMKLWWWYTQAASTVFPLRDVRSAGRAGAWGLPHWQGEHYRCRTSSSFQAILMILKVGFHLNNLVISAMMPKRTQFLWMHMRESHRIWAPAPHCLEGFQCNVWRLPVKICFCILFRCDGVHGEGGGLHHFVLKERDVQFLQGPTPNSRAWFYFYNPPTSLLLLLQCIVNVEHVKQRLIWIFMFAQFEFT